MKKKEKNNPATDLPEMITVAELRDYLRISNKYAYELVRQRSFPSIKIGNKFLINKSKLIEWMEKQYLRTE